MAAMRAEAREVARHHTCHSGSTTIRQILNPEGEDTLMVMGGMSRLVPEAGTGFRPQRLGKPQPCPEQLHQGHSGPGLPLAEAVPALGAALP
jgi:hypothetical protein